MFSDLTRFQLSLIPTVPHAISLIASFWLIFKYSKSNQKPFDLTLVMLLACSSFVFHILSISLFWSDDSLAILGIWRLSQIFSLTWAVVMAYILYKSEAELPVAEKLWRIEWIILGALAFALLYFSLLSVF